MDSFPVAFNRHFMKNKVPVKTLVKKFLLLDIVHIYFKHIYFLGSQTLDFNMNINETQDVYPTSFSIIVFALNVVFTQ